MLSLQSSLNMVDKVFQSADPITIQQQRATGVEIQKKENVPL